MVALFVNRNVDLTLDARAVQDGHADGGIMWPVFAAQDGNFDLFPFAKSGATCSNNLTFRPFPSVFIFALSAASLLTASHVTSLASSAF